MCTSAQERLAQGDDLVLSFSSTVQSTECAAPAADGASAGGVLQRQPDNVTRPRIGCSAHRVVVPASGPVLITLAAVARRHGLGEFHRGGGGTAWRKRLQEIRGCMDSDRCSLQALHAPSCRWLNVLSCCAQHGRNHSQSDNHSDANLRPKKLLSDHNKITITYRWYP